MTKNEAKSGSKDKNIFEAQTQTDVQLPLMESFYTIQGEGAYQGYAAYFIRLAGCDVGCSWCDVKESWDAEKHPVKSCGLMANEAKDSGAPIAVVTGGEPLLWDLEPLTSALKTKGLRTHIETSGTKAFSGQWDWVCFSPKKFMAPHEDAYRFADELKIIVYNKNDFQWALGHAAKTRPGCRWLLQPEWSKSNEMLPLIVDFVKDNPKWQISLQTHKYMEIP